LTATGALSPNQRRTENQPIVLAFEFIPKQSNQQPATNTLKQEIAISQIKETQSHNTNTPFSLTQKYKQEPPTRLQLKTHKQD